eukprot:TRINITY_DN3274_c1_g1_i1.p1 TRINITY_DN3274_c1_g1~~TRINITY_DN3274_c1_g1_i1.p1  ORF type:complete len:402 (+),score=0.32 TRINITY_DN3274_c1_g1_i1:195-1400(+)
MITQRAALAYERYRRLPPDTLAHRTTLPPPPPPPNAITTHPRPHWRSRAIQALTLSHVTRYPIATPPPRPLPDLPPKNPVIITHTLGGTDKGPPPQERLQHALSEYSTIPTPDYELWTDGSCNTDQLTGGAGWILRTPDTVSNGSLPLGVCPSSYSAELAATLDGLTEAHNQCAARQLLRPSAPPPTLHMFTDSLSVLTRLAHPPNNSTPDKERLAAHLLSSWPGPVMARHVPAHVGLRYNEAADRLANSAAAAASPGSHAYKVSLDLRDVRGALRHLVATQRPPHSSDGPLGLTGKGSPQDRLPDGSIPTRRLLTRVAQVCTNHSPTLSAWLHRVQPTLTPTPQCHRCGSPKDDAAHLVSHCPALAHLRAQVNMSSPPTRLQVLHLVALLTSSPNLLPTS